MKNMNINEFVNMMYEGREIIFEYNEKIYNFEISDNLINLYQIFDIAYNILCKFKFNRMLPKSLK